MIKREDSLRSIGYTSIGTEKETKAKLQAAADRAGLPLSEYLRKLADQAIIGKQGTLLPDIKSQSESFTEVKKELSGISQAIAVLIEGFAEMFERMEGADKGSYQMRPFVVKALKAISHLSQWANEPVIEIDLNDAVDRIKSLPGERIQSKLSLENGE